MRINLWCARASTDAPGPLERWCSDWLSGDEAARAGRLRQRTSRNQFVVGRGMCRTLIASRAAVAPSEVQFRLTPHGKPEVAAPCNAIVQFNLAHTDRLVVCALGGQTPIGVDVERLDRATNVGLADRYFARSEAEWLGSLPVNRQREGFLRVWTLKEAFIKAIGSGLSTPLDAFAFEAIESSAPRLRLLDDRLGDAGQWSFATLHPCNGYVASIALRTPEPIDAQAANFDPLTASD